LVRGDLNPKSHLAGVYSEIFRGRGFEIFLYRRENLGGVL